MAEPDFPKAYESKDYEDGIYAAWEQSGFFHPENLPGERTEAFSIVLPPPNVTGTLHMGHAVMLAIEDIMVRFARMRGKKALWIPGTDHAAIATQAKVERELIDSGLKDPRRELGREAFLGHVEAFAAKSHDTIVNQMKKMGASVDWEREAFTLDDVRSKAVRTVFKMMHDDGLIYRGERVVNWCPRCQSTLSDDELAYKETTARLFTFTYDKDFPIPVSSTRPETKFGDTAVAVHPEGKWKEFIGQELQADFLGVPLALKVVGDESVDPAFGTGALGVTPAHSKADEEIAKRHGIASKTVIDERGEMNAGAGEFAGLGTLSARKAVAKRLEAAGLLQGAEDSAQNLSVCYRCDTPVEPLPKTQWFIDVNKSFAFRASTGAPIQGIAEGQEVTLKFLMRHAVESGQVRIMPESFAKTYFHWIDNLRDWNISRQIWYGHQVPVWTRGGETHVGEAPDGDGWAQDPDTLDTWFSSGLWTLSTLGWPDKTDALRLFHPTSVLETGYDILFFWVARMVLMTTYAVGEVPFRTVYLHGLVRDEEGRKMSKSLGNAIDPLGMIARYGADATRLSLVIGASPGGDMKLSERKVAGYRNFTNKLWNVSRFVLGSVGNVLPVAKPEPSTRADRWILSRFETVVRDVTAHLEAHEFSAAGEKLREFTWSEFADWYLEMSKVDRNDSVLLYILERLLALWHPFMPFVTEEIWKRFGGEEPLMIRAWPEAGMQADADAERAFDAVRETVVAIRNLRAQYRVEPGKKLSARIVSPSLHALYQEQAPIISRLAGLDALEVLAEGERPEGSAAAVLPDAAVYLALAGVADLAAERSRLAKEAADLERYVATLDAKLADAEFVKKAPEHVVASMRQKHEEAVEQIQSIRTQIESLV